MGIWDLFSNSTAEEAAQQRNQGLQQGYNALSQNYDQARGALTSNYGDASSLYKNLLSSYAPGVQAYGDATGTNGAAGNARAVQNFQSAPGYNFTMDQGLQALNRTHAAAGNLNSGNADTDTLKYATGLANQGYQQYVQNLSPYFQGQGSATAGAAGVSTGLGTNLANLYGAQGAAANANYTGQGASNAAATMNNYNVGQNQLGALLGVGSLALGGVGGVGGLGGITGGFGGNGFSLGPTSVGGAPVSGGLFSMFK